jgi:hypothetical protein
VLRRDLLPRLEDEDAALLCERRRFPDAPFLFDSRRAIVRRCFCTQYTHRRKNLTGEALLFFLKLY